VGKHSKKKPTTHEKEIQKKRKKKEILDEKSLFFRCEYSVHVTNLN